MYIENYYLQTFSWESFDEKLFERLSKTQKNINEEGYYPKERDTVKYGSKMNLQKSELVYEDYS